MMEILELSSKEYGQVFDRPYHVFNGAAFSELNKHKCEGLHYLAFKDSKIRLGLVLGERDGVLCSPFSAPFGGFSSLRTVDVEAYEEAVMALKQYAAEHRMPVRISLPPAFYGETHISKSFSALLRGGARILYSDLNYQYRLAHFENFEANLERNAKKNFHNALKSNFVFEPLNSDNQNEVARAYEVIRKNRASKGFPLRMTLQDVLDTIKVIRAGFFVMSYEGVDVAAAQVFHVSEGICQVIYWGDLLEYSHLRVMNYFTYKVFEHYFNQGLKILDIGPSTEKGIPNYGLCSFKESIGCEVSLKHTFEL